MGVPSLKLKLILKEHTSLLQMEHDEDDIGGIRS